MIGSIYRLGMNSQANSKSPLKRTKVPHLFYEDFKSRVEWTRSFAIAQDWKFIPRRSRELTHSLLGKSYLYRYLKQQKF